MNRREVQKFISECRDSGMKDQFIISIYFAIEISRYHAPMYTACGLIPFVGFVRSMDQKGITMNDIIISAFFCAAIADLVFTSVAKCSLIILPKN